MPSMNQKNMALSPAVSALGLGSTLGDALIEQVDAESNLRKKKVREMEHMSMMTGAVGALLGTGSVGTGNG